MLRHQAIRKGCDRRSMTFQHRIGLSFARCPDRNAPIGACGRRTSVPEQGHRIDGVGVEAKHLLGRICCQRPADRR
jgi:hypothetical protein